MKIVNIEIDDSIELEIDCTEIQTNVACIIDYMTRYSSYEINLIVTDDESIREINREQRGKDKATDVLSFPLEIENVSLPHKILGTIFISYDTMKRQAKELCTKNKDEFYRLLVHGTLHLLGYDHEIDEVHEKIMQTKEDVCLDLIFAK